MWNVKYWNITLKDIYLPFLFFQKKNAELKEEEVVSVVYVVTNSDDYHL